MAPSTRVLGCIFVAARAANRRKEKTSSKMGSKKEDLFLLAPRRLPFYYSSAVDEGIFIIG